MNETLLARIVRWGIYATAIIPLIIFSQYISPFHFGKVIVFRSMIEVLLPFWLVLLWRDRAYAPRMSWVLWALIAFAGAFSLTTVTSVNPFMSFWGTLERMGGVWTFWHYVVFVLMAVSVLRTREQWMTLVHATISFGILSAFYGFLQRGPQLSLIVGSGDRARIFGTIGNAALFAGYQILCLFLSVTLWFSPRTTSALRWLYGSAILFCSIAVLMTAVRGSLLGLAAGALTFALLWSTLNRSRAARVTLLGGISALALFFILGMALQGSSLIKNSPYLTRITAFSPQTYTVQTRFWAWSAGFRGWSESPKTVLLGWGPENFNIPFSKYFNPKFFTGPGSETLFDRAHNMFVEVLVTMGLVGFIAYNAIFIAALAMLWRLAKRGGEARTVAVGFTALLVAYAIHNSFIFDTSANFYAFFLIMGFLSFIYGTEFSGTLPKVPSSMRRMTVFQGLVLMLLLVVFGTLAWRTNVRAAEANYATTRAIIAGWQNDTKTAFTKYQEALAYTGAGRYEIRHRFAQYILEVLATENKLTPDAIAALKVAEEVVLQNVQENPQDYLPVLYLSRIYINLGKEDTKSPYNDKALEMANKALEISPTFVRTYYEVAQAYLNKGDFANAAAAFQKATELNSDVGLSWWYWGIVTMQSGNTAKGKQLINEAIARGYRLTEADLSRLLGAYLAGKDYAAAVGLMEQVVRGQPTVARYWEMLAAVYAKAGRVDDAVTAIRKTIELDASYKADGEKFIRSLGRTP